MKSVSFKKHNHKKKSKYKPTEKFTKIEILKAY